MTKSYITFGDKKFTAKRMYNLIVAKQARPENIERLQRTGDWNDMAKLEKIKTDLVIRKSLLAALNTLRGEILACMDSYRAELLAGAIGSLEEPTDTIGYEVIISLILCLRSRQYKRFEYLTDEFIRRHCSISE